MNGHRSFNYIRYELATEPNVVTLDIYDDGRVCLWTGEEKAWLEAADREEIVSVLTQRHAAPLALTRPRA